MGLRRADVKAPPIMDPCPGLMDNASPGNPARSTMLLYTQCRQAALNPQVEAVGIGHTVNLTPSHPSHQIDVGACMHTHTHTEQAVVC